MKPKLLAAMPPSSRCRTGMIDTWVNRNYTDWDGECDITLSTANAALSVHSTTMLQ